MERIIQVISCFLLFVEVRANNIDVQDINLSSQNPSTKEATIGFDLSWENSWRTTNGPANHDAAWVFAKYRVSSGPWLHAKLRYVNGTTDGHEAPIGGTITGVSGGTGVFIYRSQSGTGDVVFGDVGLRWDYGATGVQNTDLVEVRVFAIEMVLVPEGAFFVGDPEGGATNSFRRRTFKDGSFGWGPYQVTSDGEIIFTTFGFSYLSDNSTAGDGLLPIPASYPLGFDAFYSMKYEVTQGQWVDFFNTLTPAQKVARDVTGIPGKSSDDVASRNAVSWADSGSASTSLPNVPISYVGHEDVTAYLDWSGLRPMSEFEFEKACRGPQAVVSGEFAWGSSNIHSAVYTIAGSGTSSERVSNPGSSGNATYTQTAIGLGGPLRVGIHAASATISTRERTGASYYGIMDLSGNLYERLVTCGTPGGRAFVPNHGDGTLTIGGESNVSNWHGPGDGSYRGASYINRSDFLRVSDRTDGANPANINNGRIGFRGVRSAP